MHESMYDYNVSLLSLLYKQCTTNKSTYYEAELSCLKIILKIMFFN